MYYVTLAKQSSLKISAFSLYVSSLFIYAIVFIIFTYYILFIIYVVFTVFIIYINNLSFILCSIPGCYRMLKIILN